MKHIIWRHRTLCFIAALAVTLAAAGCTENRRARLYGGTVVQSLPSNTKLVTATWKQDNLWVLTRPMHTNEVPETYEFRESSSYGIIEGKVVLVESR